MKIQLTNLEKSSSTVNKQRLAEQGFIYQGNSYQQPTCRIPVLNRQSLAELGIGRVYLPPYSPHAPKIMEDFVYIIRELLAFTTLASPYTVANVLYGYSLCTPLFSGLTDGQMRKTDISDKQITDRSDRQIRQTDNRQMDQTDGSHRQTRQTDKRTDQTNISNRLFRQMKPTDQTDRCN